MADKEQINILVTPEKKKKWKRYAEEEYGTLTLLISTAVENEIAGANDSPRAGEVPEDINKRLMALENGNDGIRSELRGVKRELRDVKSAVEQPDESIREVANQILDVLPNVRLGHTTPDDPPTTVDDLVDELEEPRDVVIESLDMLETGTHMIRSDDRGFYWRTA